MGSSHEADVSDVESLCSAVSDTEPLMTRTRGRRRQPRTDSQEDEEVSEVESCSSAVSASRAGRSSRRSTRKKMVSETSDPAHVEAEDVKVSLVLEDNSCSSAVSESQRVTRSLRKTARTRSSAKQQSEDTELSDADSCMSNASGAAVSKSTTRRVTRSRKQTGPIPIHLDESSERSLSPAPTTRRSRATRGKAASTADVSEPQSCESEGFESGPMYSRSTLRRGKTQSTGPKAVDSDSDLTDVHSPVGSPCSTRSRGTPCSSRTGSGNSSRGTAASRRSVKDLSIVQEKAVEPAEEDTSLDDSRLETTVIAKDADCTLLEEDETQTLDDEEDKDVNSTDLTSNEADTIRVEGGVSVIIEKDSHVAPTESDSPVCAGEAVSEPAVTVSYQQEELRDERKERDPSDMEVMQETVLSSEPAEPCQSATVTLCERTDESTEEIGEKGEAVDVIDVDAQISQGDKAVDQDAAVETQPSEEEKMEVSTWSEEAQQVVDSSDVPVEPIQVTSSQQHSITVDSEPEEQQQQVIVQNKKTISLLDSSEDEDDYAEEEDREVSEEEEEDLKAEERGGPSHKSEAAGTSASGLFMIDTRPGQEADEHYYRERPTEEEKITKEQRVEQDEEDEEFVDEEGDDDDDDEDGNILFSSRNPHL